MYRSEKEAGGGMHIFVVMIKKQAHTHNFSQREGNSEFIKDGRL